MWEFYRTQLLSFLLNCDIIESVKMCKVSFICFFIFDAWSVTEFIASANEAVLRFRTGGKEAAIAEGDLPLTGSE